MIRSYIFQSIESVLHSQRSQLFEDMTEICSPPSFTDLKHISGKFKFLLCHDWTISARIGRLSLNFPIFHLPLELLSKQITVPPPPPPPQVCPQHAIYVGNGSIGEHLSNRSLWTALKPTTSKPNNLQHNPKAKGCVRCRITLHKISWLMIITLPPCSFQKKLNHPSRKTQMRPNLPNSKIGGASNSQSDPFPPLQSTIGRIT